MGQFISTMTYPELRDALNQNSIVLLPVGGGSKEHGYHLPMGTDWFVANYLAKKLTERCNVLTLPTVPYGYFPLFVNWEGTVSIESQHFIDFIKDIILSYARFGVRKFFILDDGVTTHFPLTIASQTLNNDHGLKVAVSNINGIGIDKMRELVKQERGTHADELETSMMLKIQPDLVDMEKAEEEYRHLFPHTFAGRQEKVFLPLDMDTAHGVYGNSKLATPEKGEQALEAILTDMQLFLDAFARWNIGEPFPGE